MTTDRISLKEMYMRIAEVIAQRSSCERRKVGCIIVKNNQILAEGYNGMPPGWSNDCEDEEGNTKDCVSHAEENAIAKAASSSISCRGGTLFCTLQPCKDCSKLIIQSNIRQVYYREPYRDTSPVRFLKKCNVLVNKL